MFRFQKHQCPRAFVVSSVRALAHRPASLEECTPADLLYSDPTPPQKPGCLGGQISVISVSRYPITHFWWFGGLFSYGKQRGGPLAPRRHLRCGLTSIHQEDLVPFLAGGFEHLALTDLASSVAHNVTILCRHAVTPRRFLFGLDDFSILGREADTPPLGVRWLILITNYLTFVFPWTISQDIGDMGFGANTSQGVLACRGLVRSVGWFS